MRAKDIRSGFYNFKETKTGQIVKEYIEDGRKAAISSVIALLHLLRPETERDEVFLKYFKEFKASKKKLWDTYKYTERERVMGKNSQVVWAPTGRSFMPEVDATVIILNQVFNRAVISPKGWNNYISAYFDALLEIHDELFANLMILIDGLNYFKPTTSYG